VGRIDESRLPSLVAATRASGVAQVPTQALFEHWVGPDEPAAMARWPEMRFVEPAQLADWIRNKQELTAKAPSADRARFLELRRRLLKAMQDGGVRLLLGSDAPQVWNVPGFSLHRELEYLVRAGLTPYQALESGTRHIAEFFGTGAERGTIEVGRRADLVLVEDNPLKDIRQTSRIALVIVNGHVLTREEIDARLKQLERGR
jgi:imidazolonepropionase-like amidohydrolase